MESSSPAHPKGMFTKVTTFILILLTLACTSSVKKNPVSIPADLNGEWDLAGVFPDTIDLKKAKVGKWPSITIDTGKKTIFGYSGCNSFGGEFTLSKDKIVIGELMANQLGCPGSVEPVLFKHLRSTNAYAVTSDSLKLYARDTLLLSFVRKSIQPK